MIFREKYASVNEFFVKESSSDHCALNMRQRGKGSHHRRPLLHPSLLHVTYCADGSLLTTVVVVVAVETVVDRADHENSGESVTIVVTNGAGGDGSDLQSRSLDQLSDY